MSNKVDLSLDIERVHSKESERSKEVRVAMGSPTDMASQSEYSFFDDSEMSGMSDDGGGTWRDGKGLSDAISDDEQALGGDFNNESMAPHFLFLPLTRSRTREASQNMWSEVLWLFSNFLLSLSTPIEGIMLGISR